VKCGPSAILGFVALLEICAPARAFAPPPQLPANDLSDIDVPHAPFDDTANADADVARAFAEARALNKRVLIDLGANWCADCRILSGVMDVPDTHAFLAAHYAVAIVDIGRFDRNMQVPERFGIDLRATGVPSIIIAEPDGTLVNRGHTAALVEARQMTPQAIVDWFAEWAR